MSSDSTPYREPLRAPRLAGRAVPALAAGACARAPSCSASSASPRVLNLWGLSINGWANTYYSAAVRSMTTSWHDFLFASLDKSGPDDRRQAAAGLWVQALSARVFGFHPLSILIPQALMGVGRGGADL